MGTTKRPIRKGTLPRCPTGVQGLDEVTNGGLPLGRPTLVCGGAGCGKTLLATEFLVRGILQYGETGAFISFEERAEDLAQNVASLGFDLKQLVAEKRLSIDHVNIGRTEILEAGEYDLEGLFVRLEHAIDSVKAKRVVLDSIESLFGGLANQAILRSELRRLFHWLKDKAVTAIITGERGDATLTRQGLEEYISDCVILLDHRLTDQVFTRRLRVVKYRGSTHGTNEYPFLIDEDGFSIMPVTSLGLNHGASTERISTGIPRLDTMLDGKGFFRGSAILVSGTAGTGKTSLAAHLVNAACQRNERSLYFAFEEAEGEIVRNMGSLGLDLGRWVKDGLLHFNTTRPTVYGLEMHLARMFKVVDQLKPKFVVVDPISGLIATGRPLEIHTMLMRLVDQLKHKGTTALLISLTSGGDPTEQTDFGVSSLVDAWIVLKDIESAGERNRALHILKTRGMNHSNQVREFLLTGHGIELKDVYSGSGAVLAGSARLAQEARERAEALVRQQEVDRSRREVQRRRAAMEARVAAIRAEFEAEDSEALHLIGQEVEREAHLAEDVERMKESRKMDAPGNGGPSEELASSEPRKQRRRTTKS